jgi:ATP-binding cassette subfamily C protein CydD
MKKQDATAPSPGKLALRRWARSAQPAVNRATALGLLAVVFGIGIAGSLAAGVSQAVHGRGDAPWIMWAALTVAGRTCALWWGEQTAARAGLAIVEAARSEIQHAVAGRGAAQLMGEAAGARVSQIIDRTALLAGWANRWSPGSRMAVAAPVVILIAVATQSWVAALLLVVSVVTLPLFLWLTVEETRAVASAQQASLDVLASVFQTRTEHAGVIKAFRAIRRETEIVRSASEALRQQTMGVLRVAFLSTAVLEFFSAVSIALLAVYIGFKLLGLFPFETGEILTLQEGMMVLILAPEFFAPIRRLSSLHHDRADAAAAAEVLGSWLDERREPSDRLPVLHTPPRITFANVSIVFKSAPVVRGLSFEALPGQITVLGGPSGSGKTSSLLVLLGLARWTSGGVTVDGEPMRLGSSLASSVAYVRQTPWLFEGTLAENLRVGRPDASDGELFAALSAVGIGHLAAETNGGLERPIERGGQGLSGGERQRIAVGRALLRNARLWLLDEPSAHLDEAAEADLLALLRQQAPGRTIIMATHRAAVLRAADQVVLMPSTESTIA